LCVEIKRSATIASSLRSRKDAREVIGKNQPFRMVMEESLLSLPFCDYPFPSSLALFPVLIKRTDGKGEVRDETHNRKRVKSLF
jgi:hypothetical protein